jgi:hypothetical protein
MFVELYCLETKTFGGGIGLPYALLNAATAIVTQKRDELVKAINVKIEELQW